MTHVDVVVVVDEVVIQLFQVLLQVPIGSTLLADQLEAANVDVSILEHFHIVGQKILNGSPISGE